MLLSPSSAYAVLLDNGGLPVPAQYTQDSAVDAALQNQLFVCTELSGMTPKCAP